MKLNILKAVVLCTMALSLLFVGVASANIANVGLAACHDGPIHHVIRY